MGQATPKPRNVRAGEMQLPELPQTLMVSERGLPWPRPASHLWRREGSLPLAGSLHLPAEMWVTLCAEKLGDVLNHSLTPLRRHEDVCA